VASADFAGLASDSWGGLVKDTLNEAQTALFQEHDWSTLYTTATFSTSNRTYDLSASVSGFTRAVDLVSTTNNRVLVEVTLRDLDEDDPGLDDAGAPTAYHIAYPSLLFDRTPSSEAFRLRYLARPTALSAGSSTSDLPEYCDLVLIGWAHHLLLATREDVADLGRTAKAEVQLQLSRAIAQDQRRMDRLYVMQSVFPASPQRSLVPFPPAYDRSD